MSWHAIRPSNVGKRCRWVDLSCLVIYTASVAIGTSTYAEHDRDWLRRACRFLFSAIGADLTCQFELLRSNAARSASWLGTLTRRRFGKTGSSIRAASTRYDSRGLLIGNALSPTVLLRCAWHTVSELGHNHVNIRECSRRLARPTITSKPLPQPRQVPPSSVTHG